MKKAKWRRRLRGTCKWGGVTLCVLLCALWLASGWWQIGVLRIGTEGPSLTLGYLGAGTEAGSIFVCNFSTPDQLDHPWLHWHFYCSRRVTPTPPHTYGAPIAPPAWTWRFSGTSGRYQFPLWLPFLLIGLPTGYLFWSDHRRRMRAGCCEKCGYDLTGNTTGRCPECGGPADGSVTTEKAASA